jgi:glycosyltransferase involved in cell wall biosynthesis
VARAFDVDVVSFGPAGSSPLEQEIAPGLREIRAAKSARHQEEEDRIARDAVGVAIADAAIPLLWNLSPEYVDQLARSMRQAAVVIASDPYWIRAIQSARDRQFLVYEAHNVEFRLKERALRGCGPCSSTLVDVVRAAEACACTTSSLIFCCCREDQEEMANLYGVDVDRLRIAPNGADTDEIRFVGKAERTTRKADLDVAGTRLAVFVGSSDPSELEPAVAVVEIARVLPEVKFVLAGGVCASLAEQPLPANVGLMGAVDEETLAALLAVADVALNPMLGTGANLSLATYLAAGVPVVTTAFGARGYDLTDGLEALIAPSEAFPDCIARLLADGALSERLATRGRRMIAERYDWKLIGGQVVAAYRSLLGVKEPASM